MYHMTPPRRPPSLPWTCEPSAPCRTFGVSSKFHSRNESAGCRASRGCLLASVWRQTKERYQRGQEPPSRAVRISQFVPFQVRCRCLPSKNLFACAPDACPDVNFKCWLRPGLRLSNPCTTASRLDLQIPPPPRHVPRSWPPPGPWPLLAFPPPGNGRRL